MTIIRPISDLRNRAQEILELCHEEDQPVFITRNGKGDLVVMSQAHYDRLLDRLELYQKLGEAESQDALGEQGTAHEDLMDRLKARIE